MKNKLIGSTITLVLGLLILASPDHSTSTSGFLMICGSFAYKARRRQNEQPSTSWKITEIISIIIFLIYTTIGMIKGVWYDKPFTFIVIPVGFISAYVIALIDRNKLLQTNSRKNNQESKQDTLLSYEELTEDKKNKESNIKFTKEIAQESKQDLLLNLEKLAELKEKKVISKEEFENKKKIILEKI
ncbi:MAG: SHOCT domain-containing protein [Candidatus Roizmanbacteria bacterium]